MAHIVVLDDAPSICELIREMLSREQHEVSLADTVSSARNLLARGAVDILITDIYMPGEDGLQLIAHTRRRHPGVVIIAMSSKSGGWDMLAPARLLGASFTIRKPFSNLQLLSAVAQAVSQLNFPAGGAVV